MTSMAPQRQSRLAFPIVSIRVCVCVCVCVGSVLGVLIIICVQDRESHYVDCTHGIGRPHLQKPLAHGGTRERTHSGP